MSKKSSRKRYEETIQDIGFIKPSFSNVNNNDELDKGFRDIYATEQQLLRDVQITTLLTYYVEAYNKKRKSNPNYKKAIFGVSIIVLLSFSIMFLVLLYRYANVSNTVVINNIVALITVCITYLTLVIGILKIITKYVFPQKEEEYITRIVEAIQRNDLKNKKANIKSSKNKDK